MAEENKTKKNLIKIHPDSATSNEISSKDYGGMVFEEDLE